MPLNALVLGASGSIGAPLVKRLLNSGWNVAGTYRSNRHRLESLELHGAFRPFEIELRDPSSVERVVSDIASHFGAISAFINVAGYGGIPEFLVRAKRDRVYDLINVNLTSVIAATKFALPALLRAQRSAVLNVTSVAAAVPTPGVTAYAASKAGLEGFTLALAREYGSRGLAAIAVRLGPVKTPMLESLGDHSVKALTESLPRACLPSPEDVGILLEQYLGQALSGHINGCTLSVDDGYTMWRKS